MKRFEMTGILIALTLTLSVAEARPEFAAETNIVNCAVCHVNPYGGGARTVEGKAFGSRDAKTAWFSKQDIFSLDMRGMDYLVQNPPPTNSQAKGVMLMNAIPTANLPIAPDRESPALGQVVLSYNFAPVGAAIREGYYMMRLSPANSNAWFTNLLVGDFMAPFGLLTDEHRTYTKQMVAMTNRDFESGVLLTGDPNYKFHYDFAVTSGFSNGGLGSDSHPDSWALIGNIRHQILRLPLQVGLSYALEGTSASAYNLSAASVYSVFSYNRFAPSWFQGNLQAEAVFAHGWDNAGYKTAAGDGITYFIPSTAAAWQSALSDSSSVGYSFMWNWDLNRRWTLQFKSEQFIPDVDYQGDSFYRTGGGFKYYMGSNANLIVRYDHGYVNRPGLSSSDLSGIEAVGDTYLALLHIWL